MLLLIKIQPTIGLREKHLLVWDDLIEKRTSLPRLRERETANHNPILFQRY